MSKPMNNPNHQMNIDFSQTTEEVCERCKNDTFHHVYRIRKLSKLLSPTGQETIIPIQIYSCSKCNHVNSSYQPPKKEDDTL